MVLIVLCIGNNLIIGSKKTVEKTKKDLMERFDCKDCGHQGCVPTWKLEDSKVIYMKVSRGFDKFYPDDVVFKLKKCIYGLKQALMAFWRQLLLCMKSMGMTQSTADPCL